MAIILGTAVLTLMAFVFALSVTQYEPTEPEVEEKTYAPSKPEWVLRYEEWEAETRRKAWIDPEIWGDYESHCPISK